MGDGNAINGVILRSVSCADQDRSRSGISYTKYGFDVKRAVPNQGSNHVIWSDINDDGKIDPENELIFGHFHIISDATLWNLDADIDKDLMAEMERQASNFQEKLPDIKTEMLKVIPKTIDRVTFFGRLPYYVDNGYGRFGLTSDTQLLCKNTDSESKAVFFSAMHDGVHFRSEDKTFLQHFDKVCDVILKQ